MAEAQLTYAGESLLFDHQQTAQRFLDRYQRPEDLSTPPDNPARDDWHCNTYGQTRAGLPRPNYTDPPRPRLNTLWWPTGATRWARGWFLADQETYDQLTDQGNSSGPWASGIATARTLKVSTPSQDGSDEYVLEASLYMLQPLRVTATADDDYGDLWIIPLVDQRYWWQFRNAGDLTSSLASWSSLVSALSTALGVTITCPTVSSAYLIPDQIELCRSYDNAAVVLDAVAHSIGRRVVCSHEGAVRLAEYSAEKTTLTDNPEDLLASLGLIAGTPDDEDPPHHAPLPAQVVVAFPKIEDPASTGAEQHYTKTVTLATLQSTVGFTDPVSVASSSKSLHCSAWAMMQCGGSASPANQTNLDALATHYATDYYGWLLHCYDYCWAGLQKWTPTGYDDATLYECGVEYAEQLEAFAETNEQYTQYPDVHIHERLARRYQTRVQSMPANHGVSSLLCQYQYAIPGVSTALMVKTPEGGITARDCLVLGGPSCCVVYEEEQGTLTPVYCDDSATEWEIAVSNVANAAVTGSAYVLTDVLYNGTRVVTVESCDEEDCESSS